MKTVRIILPAITSVLLLAACGQQHPVQPPATSPASTPALESSATAATEALYRDFPLRHMVIQSNRAVEPNAPEGTVWVTMDDGTASQGNRHGTAVKDNGESSGPRGCTTAGDGTRWCVEEIIKVNDEVRALISFEGETCALIGSTEPGKRTRLLCGDEDRTV